MKYLSFGKVRLHYDTCMSFSSLCVLVSFPRCTNTFESANDGLTALVLSFDGLVMGQILSCTYILSNAMHKYFK